MRARKLFFDPETRGFLQRGVQPIPARAVSITATRHAQLLQAQSEGAEILVGDKGRPALRWPSVSIDARRAQAIGVVRMEMRRRCNAVADLLQRADDNADIARAAMQIALEGATTIDFAPALERYRAIDALRVRTAELAAAIGAMPANELEAADFRDDTIWNPANG